MAREFLVEWWEAWLEMPGQHPIRLNEGDFSLNELLPRGAFGTRKELKSYLKKRPYKKPDLKVRHVRHYRVKK